MKTLNLESVLREKLTDPVSSQFENEFWSKFDTEFSGDELSFLDKISQIFDQRGIVAVAACLVLAVSTSLYYKNKKADTNMTQVANMQGMLNDLEMLADTSDTNEGLDLMDLTDEEWNILLEEHS